MVVANNGKVEQKRQTDWGEENSSIHASVVSRTPGRLRLRVVPSHRQKDKIEGIASALKERLEIYRVRTNLASGSITVFHAQEHLSFENVCAILRDLGIIFLNITEGEPIDTTGKSEAAAGIMSTVTDLNKRVGLATDGTADLRVLIPITFGLLSLRQLFVKGLQFQIIPWYVLAWYAFDSFIKLHYTSDPYSKKQPPEPN